MPRDLDYRDTDDRGVMWRTLRDTTRKTSRDRQLDCGHYILRGAHYHAIAGLSESGFVHYTTCMNPFCDNPEEPPNAD